MTTSSEGNADVRGGWLPDSSIDDFIREHAAVFAGLPFHMITSVDSNADAGKMPWSLKRMKNNRGWALVTDPLIISGPALVDLVNDGDVFFGFDEVWIPTTTDTKSPPGGAYIVCPRRLDEEIPSTVRKWVKEAGIRLGLGDGDGLNFVGTDLSLMTRLGLG